MSERSIEHIDDILPAIEGRDDVVVSQRHGFQVIDYVYALEDSFDHPDRIDCRGLKFDETGAILARRRRSSQPLCKAPAPRRKGKIAPFRTKANDLSWPGPNRRNSSQRAAGARGSYAVGATSRRTTAPSRSAEGAG